MTYTPSEHIQTILNNLPLKPGVYLMKDAHGEIIYVGKAKRLRHRVRSYFTNSSQLSEKTLRMRERVADIDYVVERNEVKALILEENLIKRHMPQYNILLKDDKRYPYIKINWQDDFPKVETTRRVVQDGSKYFGPYVAMWAVQDTLQTLRKAFPYLTCNREITGKDERACLFYDIKLCNAPCIGAVDREQYRAMIAELMAVLSGRSEEVVRRLNREMEASAEALNFEMAASIRDQIRSIDIITQKNRAVGRQFTDHDVIALARDNNEAVVQILFVRHGILIGSSSHVLDGAEGESDEEVIETFIKRFYDDAPEIPRDLILPQNVEEARIIQQWLQDKRGGSKVSISVPQRGQKRDLVKMAQDNAAEALRMMRAQWEADTTKQEQALTELREALDLPTIPNRIECYDISTTQGTAIVASRVVFVQGTPKKSEYRRFNIRTVSHSGSDDYQSMREALTRRFNRYIRAHEDPTEAPPGGQDRDETWRLLPDLMIIDGGKGQLGIAVEVLKEFELFGQIPVVGLAKRFEEIYFPEKPAPLILPRNGQALFLVQRVRDEAHRFAITSHRNRRTQIGMASRLETIPGVGPARRKALLKAFDNSIDAIKNASVEELSAVKGITPDLAETIKAELAS